MKTGGGGGGGGGENGLSLTDDKLLLRSVNHKFWVRGWVLSHRERLTLSCSSRRQRGTHKQLLILWHTN